MGRINRNHRLTLLEAELTASTLQTQTVIRLRRAHIKDYAQYKDPLDFDLAQVYLQELNRREFEQAA
jgi:hypothetical protein